MTTLQEAINHYIAWQRLHGVKFVSGAYLLNSFCRCFAPDVACDEVTTDQVIGFLAGSGPLTRSRATRYGALAGFYRYAISRQYASSSPLPTDEPPRPRSPPPYIFSHEEMKRIFGAIDESRRTAHKLDAETFRTLLLVLYGTGLRRGEAIRLTLEDVNLTEAVLTVRDTKFNKSRTIPFGPQLHDALQTYAARRVARRMPAGMASTFLANTDGSELTGSTARRAFAGLLSTAGLKAGDDGRRAPCLHSLRHGFAVNRVTSWYRQGADVQRLLPVLSAYLGHKDLNGTQIYLTMTPELLQEASLRFEHYVHGDSHE
ncbi:MAG: tyrosine-type recombinase/integrase [Gammaproteobacteria bacterium]|nr:tyrosine-type recombinase/integrase [Gammaproteobacteria bacterium]MYK32681.1 tyrosine-type recombinase/integrase [Boseongicola sp. SB0670_bin_30]